MFTEYCGVSFITIHMIILNTLEKSDWQEWQPSEDRSISNSKGCSFLAVCGYSNGYRGGSKGSMEPPFQG